jgi:hypothetical protein
VQQARAPSATDAYAIGATLATLTSGGGYDGGMGGGGSGGGGGGGLHARLSHEVEALEAQLASLGQADASLATAAAAAAAAAEYAAAESATRRAALQQQQHELSTAQHDARALERKLSAASATVAAAASAEASTSRSSAEEQRLMTSIIELRARLRCKRAPPPQAATDEAEETGMAGMAEEAGVTEEAEMASPPSSSAWDAPAVPWHSLLDETRRCRTENEAATEAKEEAARRHRQLLGRRRALEAKEAEQRQQAAQALRESERALAALAALQTKLEAQREAAEARAAEATEAAAAALALADEKAEAVCAVEAAAASVRLAQAAWKAEEDTTEGQRTAHSKLSEQLAVLRAAGRTGRGRREGEEEEEEGGEDEDDEEDEASDEGVAADEAAHIEDGTLAAAVETVASLEAARMRLRTEEHHLISKQRAIDVVALEAYLTASAAAARLQVRLIATLSACMRGAATGATDCD